MTIDIPLTLRTQEQSPLTSAEVDANFTNLRDAIQQVAGFSGYRVVVGAEPPAGERENALWIPADYSGIFVWDSASGDWVAILDPLRYAVAANTANAYAVTIPGEYKTIADLNGRTITFQVLAANTDASTLKVNAFDAYPIRKNAGEDLVAGNMVAGSVYQVVFTGSVFQLLNPAVVIASEKVAAWTSPLFDVSIPPVVPSPIAHPLQSTPSGVRLVAIVKSGQATTSGWNEGDEIDSASFTSDVASQDWESAAFSIGANATTVIASPYPASSGVTFTKRNGEENKLTWSVFKTTFSLKFYLSVEGSASILLPSSQVASINERRASGTNGTTILVNATTRIVFTTNFDPNSIITSFDPATGIFRPKAGRYACTVVVPLAITGTPAQNNKQRMVIELWDETHSTQYYYITAALYDDDLSERTVVFLPILQADGTTSYSVRVVHGGSTGTAAAMVAGLSAGISGVEERYSEIQLVRLT